MLIELTRANGGGKCQLPVQSMDGFEAKERGGTIIRMNDSFRDIGSRYVGPEIHVVESHAAIRSALLKAGLLLVVVVEEEGEAVKPVTTPTKMEGRSLESLMDEYAVNASNGLLTKEHRESLQSSIIAELQRRIDAKPEQVVRLRMELCTASQDRVFYSVLCGDTVISERRGKTDAINDAVAAVRAINPSARIEWENET